MYPGKIPPGGICQNIKREHLQAELSWPPKSKCRQQFCSKKGKASPVAYFHDPSRHICRSKSHGTALDRQEPVPKWQGERTLLIFWLAAAVVTFVSSLWWLQIGMWAGVIGIIGPSLTICGCCSSRRLPLNVHVSFTTFLKCFFLVIVEIPLQRNFSNTVQRKAFFDQEAL